MQQHNQQDDYFSLPGHRRIGGTMFNRNYTEESIGGVTNFTYKPSDVVVASYPKTGQ